MNSSPAALRDTMRVMVTRVLVLALCLSTIAAQDAALLRWMDAIAQQQLARRSETIAAIRDTDSAERRRREVRAKILELIGGLPAERTPLNASVTGTRDRGGFIIENVAFESLPGLRVTANLYRPKSSGRHPAVLIPMGHWDEGKAAAQLIASNLALKGFVAMAYDPIGQGERLQGFDTRIGRSLIGGSTEQHFMAGAQSLLVGQSFARYRIWDGIRAIDYLVSRAEVDPDRIGCTGCSGGGTLTTYISALDERVKVAAPACYMNSFRTLFGGSVGDSEQSLPGFLSSGLDQTDYVELFTPKPWLIASTEQDFFTPAGARQVYDEALAWYKLHKADDRIRWVVGPGGHGTPLVVREAIYEWMIRWLKNGNGSSAEQPVDLVPDHQLWVSPRGQIDSRDVYHYIRDTPRQPKPAKEVVAFLRPLVDARPLPASRVQVLDASSGPERRPAVVVINTGKLAAERAQRFAESGNIVALVEPAGYPRTVNRAYAGDWITNTRAWLIGRNLASMRAAAVIEAVEALAKRPDVDAQKISGWASEVAGIWLLIAAALDSRLASITVERTPSSFAAALDVPAHYDLHDAVIPGFSLHWDLRDLIEAIRPRSVRWIDPTDWNRNIVRLDGPYEYRASDPNQR